MWKGWVTLPKRMNSKRSLTASLHLNIYMQIISSWKFEHIWIEDYPGKNFPLPPKKNKIKMDV